MAPEAEEESGRHRAMSERVWVCGPCDRRDGRHRVGSESTAAAAAAPTSTRMAARAERGARARTSPAPIRDGLGGKNNVNKVNKVNKVNCNVVM